MNLKEIKEIIKLMNDNELAEIEVEREGAKLKIKKTSQGTFATSALPQTLPLSHELQTEIKPVESSGSTKSSPGNLKEIVSPMVGTFYRAPSPEAPPFVEIGQVVEVGQVVCIVEAMKLMNEIKSEIRGKIVEVPVENAEPVEFGQVLFGIEPV